MINIQDYVSLSRTGKGELILAPDPTLHFVKAPLQIDSRCPQLEFRKSTAHSTTDGFKLLDRE
jgi:hypothetical protein